MTEDEAREKWCPMTRYHNNGEACGGCIASDCMMWVATAARKYTDDGDEIPTGYCGLSRK
jgi:hypothetical protein